MIAVLCLCLLGAREYPQRYIPHKGYHSAKHYMHSGKKINIENDKRVKILRDALDNKAYYNRKAHVKNFYGEFVNYPEITFNDAYSNSFWWWLLAQDVNKRAWFVYDHKYYMDPARYQLLLKDEDVRKKIAQWKKTNLPHALDYAPMDEYYLMYLDVFIKAAYNSRSSSPESVPNLWRIALIIDVVALLLYLLCHGREIFS